MLPGVNEVALGLISREQSMYSICTYMILKRRPLHHQR
jgi:hypothetical protein